MALTKLEIQLEAETSRLQRDLDKANRKIKRWAGKSKKAAAGVKKAFRGIGLAGTAAAAGLALVIAKSLETNDALAKTADKLGTTTEKLAGLQHAAELTGVAQSTLNKALTKQQKAIFDADRGLLTYAQHFDKLGLSTKELMKLDPVDQFKAIAEALKNVENQTDKTAIAYDVFGGRGTALLNTLKLGADGLGAIAEEAKILGIALSRVETAKIEEANDTFTRMKGVMKGLGNSITIALAPVLDALGKQFVEAAKESGGMVTFVNKGMNQIVSAVGFVLDVFNSLKIVWKGLEIAFAATASVIVGLINIIITPFKVLLQALAPFSDIAASALVAIENVTNSVFDNLTTKKAEFDALLNAPPPSAGLDQWVAETQAAAQLVAEAKAASVLGGQGQEGSIDELETRQEGIDAILAMELDLEDKLASARLKSVNFRIKLEKKFSDVSKNFRQNTQNNALGLLFTLGQKSKAFAITALIAEKAIAIQRVLIQSKVAAMAALTPPPIGLGPVAGAPLAAAIATSGYASAGFIAATGAVQLSSLGDNGGASGGSGISIGSNDLINNDAASSQSQQSNAPATININIEGGIADRDTAEKIADSLREYFDDGGRQFV